QELIDGTLDPAAPHPRRRAEMASSLPLKFSVAEESGGGAPSPRNERALAAADTSLSRTPRLESSPRFALRAEAPGVVGPLREETGAFTITVGIANGGESKSVSYSFPKTGWNEWWKAHQAEFDPSTVSAVARSWPGFATRSTNTGASSPCPADGWDNGLLD